MTRLLLFLGLGLLILGGCVPAKKLMYYQAKDEFKNRSKIPVDSVLRIHQLNIQEYRIQPLDLLSVNFETLSDQNDVFDFLSRISPQSRSGAGVNAAAISGVLVSKEGDIEYGVLGKIKVGGLTLFEAQDKIKAVAAQYIADVVVRVRMLNFRYTVLGEVNGEKTMVALNPRLTMSEAIGLAGGFGELADRTKIKVIRQNGDQVEIHYINLLDEQFLASKYYYVQQNDVIVVPPLKQRTFRRYFMGNLGIVTTAISFGLLVLSLSNRF